MTIETVPFDELPEFMPLGTGGKKKYPWVTMQPGHGFRFDPGITLTSARSQVANAMRGAGQDRKFIVRVDANENIWCIRIDGLSIEKRDAWRSKQAPITRTAEVTDDMFSDMRETGPYIATSKPHGLHNSIVEEYSIEPDEPQI